MNWVIAVMNIETKSKATPDWVANNNACNTVDTNVNAAKSHAFTALEVTRVVTSATKIGKSVPMTRVSNDIVCISFLLTFYM